MKQNWTHWYLLTMLGVFPLWLGWEGYGNLTMQKYAFFAAVTALWLVGLVVLTGWEALRPAHRHAGRWCVLALMAGLCLSALCSPYRAEAIIGPSRYDGLFTWLLYGGIFLGVSAYGRLRQSYAWVLALSGTVNGVIAVIQLLGCNCLWLFPNARTFYDSGVYYTGEFLGLIGNTDLLAAFFCLVIPVCFGMFLVFGGGRGTAFLLPGGLCLFVLLKSGVSGGLAGLLLCALSAPMLITDRERLSRGLLLLALMATITGISMSLRFSATGARFVLCKPTAVLLLTAGLFAAAGQFFRKSNLVFRKLPRILAFLEVLCLASALALVYLCPPEEGTLYEISRVLHGELLPSFGSSRVEIWQNVWELVRERPLLGGGPGTLELRTDLEFSRFVEESGRMLRTHVDNAHNEYLNLLVNGGFVSLLPYLGLMSATLWRFWKHRDSRITCVLALPLLAWWGQALFGLGLCIVVPLLWCVLGLFWPVDDNNVM